MSTLESFCRLFVNDRVPYSRMNVSFNTGNNLVPEWAENGWLDYYETGSVNGNQIYRIKISQKGRDVLTFNEL